MVLGLGVYFFATYFLIGHYVESRGIYHNPVLPGEERIPFIPESVLIYSLIYLVPPAGFLVLKTWEELKKAVTVSLTGLVIHQVIWIFFPVKYLLRPEQKLYADSVWFPLIQFIYGLDTPSINCLPSFHVTFSFLLYFVLDHFRHRTAPYFLIVSFLIALSTLTFKQHYLADVVSALVMAFILKIVILRYPKDQRSP